MVQNFTIFADRSASAKIKTVKIAASAISIAPCLPVTGAAKIKTVKIFSGVLRGDSAKFCTHENVPLYSIWFAMVFVHSPTIL